MWRARRVMRLLLIYYFWLAIYSNSQTVFGYRLSSMLTYTLGAALLNTLVFGSRSVDVGGEIATGNILNFLLKPIDYLKYWLTRDAADKILNLIFEVFELSLLIFLLKPPLVFPNNIISFFVFGFAVILSMLLFFYLSLLISMTTFWYPDHAGWPARFLFTIIITFIAGELFPLDILPKQVFNLFLFLPTSYLSFFPLQIWLGRIQGKTILFGIFIMLFWIIILKKLAFLMWEKGIKAYEAYGK